MICTSMIIGAATNDTKERTFDLSLSLVFSFTISSAASDEAIEPSKATMNVILI